MGFYKNSNNSIQPGNSKINLILFNETKKCLFMKNTHTHTLSYTFINIHTMKTITKITTNLIKFPKRKKKVLHSLSYNFFFEVFLLWALKEQKPSKNYNNNKKCKNKTKRLLNTKDGKLIIVYTTPLEFFTADYPSHK